MPPLAPKVTARLAAAVPSKAQNKSSVSTQTGSLASSARRVISRSARFSARTPARSANAWYISAKAGA